MDHLVRGLQGRYAVEAGPVGLPGEGGELGQRREVQGALGGPDHAGGAGTPLDVGAGDLQLASGEVERTLNMGVGMVAVLPESEVDEAVRLLASRDLTAWVCGSAAPAGSGTRTPVSLFGTQPTS